MLCKRCHHTDEAHKSSQESTSILKSGNCIIPNCKCQEFLDAMKQIDEELL